MSFENKRILVVGGAGFVGSNLSHRLLTENIKDLTIVDNLLSAEAENIPKDSRVRFLLGSIADDMTLKSVGTGFDYVFHLSTYHGNQSSQANPIADHENNTLTTLKLCEHLKDDKALIKLVYASAGCVVAEKTFDKCEATTEDAAISPYMDSPYQISKIIGEFYGNYYWRRHNIPFVKARFQNVYGPKEVLGAGQWRGTPATVWRNVTPTFIWKALHKEKLPLENGGNASRDFIYVSDIVEGLIACALNGKAGGVYNLASGKETTILELASLINRLTENPTALDLQPARSWDRSGKRFGDPTQSYEQIGFRAQISLEQGLQAAIHWTRENKEWIRSVMQRHRFFLPDVSKY